MFIYNATFHSQVNHTTHSERGVCSSSWHVYLVSEHSEFSEVDAMSACVADQLPHQWGSGGFYSRGSGRALMCR